MMKKTLQENKVTWNPHLIPSSEYFTDEGRMLLLRMVQECKKKKHFFTFVREALNADYAGKNSNIP